VGRSTPSSKPEVDGQEAIENHRSGSVLNQMLHQDTAAHTWYRFVLSFPPHLVRDYLTRFEIKPHNHVLDPFCGTGTTLVECKKLGISSVGIEAIPIAQFAAAVKTDWHPLVDRLLVTATQIAETTQQQYEKHPPPPWQTLTADQHQVLLKNSISALPLHKTLVLLHQIQAQAQPTEERHFTLALAKALISSIGNLYFGPEVGVGTSKGDAPVVEAWLQEVKTMGQDLYHLQGLANVPAAVHLADARQMHPLIERASIDAVITSPPYPNEKDYTRTTRLESVVLGFIQNKADLRTLKETLLRSNTRNVFKADTDDQWVSLHPEIQRLATSIEERRIALGKTSGFERMYHRAVKLYFGGMVRHLADLRPLLRPGAQLAYVVGDQKSYLQVMIRTGELLGDLAQALGYELVTIDLFRTRLATATKEQLREEVLVLRWPGTMPTASYPFSHLAL
jgi:DNA methylase